MALEVIFMSQPCGLLGRHVGLVYVEEVSAGFAVQMILVDQRERFAAFQALAFLHLAILSYA
jgi:hypothetical protein